MRILIYVNYYSGLCMVNRLESEGHIVDVYIDEDCNKELYDNLTNKVDTLQEGLDNDPDLVIFDSIKSGKEADEIKNLGIPVIGAGEFNDKLELDRSFGLEIMKEVGIDIPETLDFDNLEDGINYIQENPRRYVVKLDDDKSDFSSYVGKSPEDMINMLEHFYDEELIKDGDEYVLQEFIEGYEISTEGWFDGEQFIPELFNHCIEEKKFLTGNLGPTTGSSGSLVFFPEYKDSKLLIDNLYKMEDILRENDYRGAIDLNTIVDKNGKPWALEFCPRFGYICLENFMELYEGDFGELLYGIAIGDVRGVRVSKDMCIGVLVTVPPYPMYELPGDIPEKELDKLQYYLGKRSYNLMIKGYEEFEDSCYFVGVKMNEEGQLKVATYDGYLFSVCGRGNTIDQAKKLVCDRLDKLEIPEKQYRIDIGDRGKEWFNKYQKLTLMRNR